MADLWPLPQQTPPLTGEKSFYYEKLVDRKSKPPNTDSICPIIESTFLLTAIFIRIILPDGSLFFLRAVHGKKVKLTTLLQILYLRSLWPLNISHCFKHFPLRRVGNNVRKLVGLVLYLWGEGEDAKAALNLATFYHHLTSGIRFAKLIQVHVDENCENKIWTIEKEYFMLDNDSDIATKRIIHNQIWRFFYS